MKSPTFLLRSLLLFPLVALACALVPLATPTLTPTQPPTYVLPTEVVTPTNASTLPASPTPEGMWIRLVPDTAPPGARVTIHGFLPGGPLQSDLVANTELATANVCWGSCLNDLVEEGLSVSWSPEQAGQFTIEFIVPPAPWLSTLGPQPLTPGDYTVSLQCLEIERQGCALREGQASAVLHLQGPAPLDCQAGQPCGQLVLSPPQAPPGARVQVQGFAPLVNIISDRAFGYSLVLQLADGSIQPLWETQVEQDLSGQISGYFVVPLQTPGSQLLEPGQYNLALQAIRPQAAAPLVAPTPFEVLAPFAWSSLKLGKPLWVQPSANLSDPLIAVDPGNPDRLAYCLPGEIRHSPDGGQSWNSIPTLNAPAAMEGSGYALGWPDATPEQVACLSVTLDRPHPDSYFAVFQAVNPQYGAPPVFFMGLYTIDAGHTWHLLAPPAQDQMESFGGFWADSQGVVQALFPGPPGAQDAPLEVVVQQTADGGQSWNPGLLACPGSGPCLRWGPAPGSISGMGAGAPQWIYASSDNGSTWIPPGPSVELRLPGTSASVAFNATHAALLSGAAEFPLRVTQDAGKTWQVITLPLVEGGASGSVSYPGLQILPDGSLIAQSPREARWLILTPGSQDWCRLEPGLLPDYPTLFQVSGERLWWLHPLEMQPGNIPLGSLQCSG